MASNFIFIFDQQIWGDECARLIAVKHCQHKEILQNDTFIAFKFY